VRNANIVLVGFMGTGKSATGRILSRRLERVLIDMDAMIEEREGRTISQIFEREGEAYFRAIERNLVRELSQRQNLVIAAGGGVVLDPDNLRDLTRTGVVICLTASPGAILQRVGESKHRPLLDTDDKAYQILQLLVSRRPLYDAISHQLDTSHLSPDVVAGRVMEIYEQAVKAGDP
jgi:shikimate kinase